MEGVGRGGGGDVMGWVRSGVGVGGSGVGGWVCITCGAGVGVGAADGSGRQPARQPTSTRVCSKVWMQVLTALVNSESINLTVTQVLSANRL